VLALSGRVPPISTDGGSSTSAATSAFAAVSSAGASPTSTCSRGYTAAYASRSAKWPSAVTATPTSGRPNVRSGRASRGARRPQYHPPAAMPVQKMAIVSAAAWAVLPTSRPTSRTHSTC
jgi:hypothetical protein